MTETPDGCVVCKINGRHSPMYGVMADGVPIVSGGALPARTCTSNSANAPPSAPAHTRALTLRALLRAPRAQFGSLGDEGLVPTNLDECGGWVLLLYACTSPRWHAASTTPRGPQWSGPGHADAARHHHPAATLTSRTLTTTIIFPPPRRRPTPCGASWAASSRALAPCPRPPHACRAPPSSTSLACRSTG